MSAVLAVSREVKVPIVFIFTHERVAVLRLVSALRGHPSWREEEDGLERYFDSDSLTIDAMLIILCSPRRPC